MVRGTARWRIDIHRLRQALCRRGAASARSVHPVTEPIILVVEDDSSMRKFVADALANRGHAVTAVATGEQAVEVLSRMPQPDLVILDLGLPGIDGLTVLDKLRRTSITPVLVLSARGSQSDKVRALDAGADDYLAKPFGLPELLALSLIHISEPTRLGMISYAVFC